MLYNSFRIQILFQFTPFFIIFAQDITHLLIQIPQNSCFRTWSIVDTITVFQSSEKPPISNLLLITSTSLDTFLQYGLFFNITYKSSFCFCNYKSVRIESLSQIYYRHIAYNLSFLLLAYHPTCGKFKHKVTFKC